PVFRTTEGDVKPEEKTIYQAVTDHDLIMQDMSKRDKKKYMKLHNLK
ncbi:M23 family peptidase, partial [Bacteroides ovatus]